MNLGFLPQRKWKVTLGGTLTLLLATAPAVWFGSVCLHSLSGGSDKLQLAGVDWPKVWTTLLPGPGALLAALMLLVPFGLSTLRLRRRS
jgi:hypothetical protein